MPIVVKKVKITKLYAFIMKKDGMEGILGFNLPDGACWPLIGLDMGDIHKIRPIVDALSKERGIKYEIRAFQRSLI